MRVMFPYNGEWQLWYALSLDWPVLLIIKQNLPNLNCSLSMRRIDAGAHLWKTKDRLYQFYWVTFPTKKIWIR